RPHSRRSGRRRAAPLAPADRTGDRAAAPPARTLLHIAMGLPALAVRPLGVGGAAALAAAAIGFNVVLLPRVGGRQLWRPADRRRGWSPGIVAYPVVVLTMLLVWHRRPEVAAAGWGVLAFGDGFASLLGGRWGRHASLPWNPAKSWLGLGSFVAGGTCAAALLLVWTAPGRYAPGFAL